MAYWFLFFNDEMLLKATEDSADIPVASDIDILNLDLTEAQYIGLLNDNECYAVNLPDSNVPEKFCFQKVREVYRYVEEESLGLAFRAFHIMTWIKNNKYCGRCGGFMKVAAQELAVKCTDCSNLIYPRISPAIIVAVTKGDKILLARSSRFPPGRYSVIAGFVEPGETLEDCVSREVKEEVGIEVTNVEYFGNQPWPFPDSLMVAFTAQSANEEITIDNDEIVDANWFTAQNLPNLPPQDSIARRLIEWFVNKQA